MIAESKGETDIATALSSGGLLSPKVSLRWSLTLIAAAKSIARTGEYRSYELLDCNLNAIRLGVRLNHPDPARIIGGEGSSYGEREVASRSRCRRPWGVTYCLSIDGFRPLLLKSFAMPPHSLRRLRVPCSVR